MKTTDTKHYVGIDVSKDHLDVWTPSWAQPKRYDNRPARRRALFKDLCALDGSCHLICEATGGYEACLLDEASQREVPISRVNPRQIRDFARAKGLLAKTDQIDARTITHYGEVFSPAPTMPPSAVLKRLSAACRRRENLMRQLNQERIALQKTTDSFVRKDIRKLIGVLENRIGKFDKEISELIDGQDDLKEKRERLEEVKGVGPGVSSVLLAEMPELGQIGDKQAAALVGLAPMNRDSGKHRGKRSIQAGRGQIRRALYMPAMCAVRFNPILKAIYERLRAKGKAHHVAITAVMRKLICLLNRILADPNFTPA